MWLVPLLFFMVLLFCMRGIFGTALARSPALLLGLCLAGSAVAEQTRYPDLWDSVDAGLQTALEQMLAGMHPEFMKAVRNQKLAVAVVDVTELQDPRVASINGDVMLYAASLPKIAIVVTRPDMEYIVVVVADHEAGGEGIVELIVAIDNLMPERHQPP